MPSNSIAQTVDRYLETLRKHCVDVETVEWPENVADKTLLKASLSPARQKMAKHMRFDIRAHREKA